MKVVRLSWRAALCAAAIPTLLPADAAAQGAFSAKQIKEENPSAPSGVYQIDPDGNGPIAAFPVYCDMTTDGGGWMLAVHSLSTSQAPWSDMDDNRGTVSFSTGHTTNLTHYAINHQAEIRHEIVKGATVFHAKYTGKYHDNFPASMADFTTMPGHTPGAETTLNVAYHFGVDWSTLEDDRDELAGANCLTQLNAGPWYHRACVSIHPSYNGGPYVAGAANQYSIWIREIDAPAPASVDEVVALDRDTRERADVLIAESCC